MKISTAIKADRAFRDYRKALTLIDTINRRMAYYEKHHSDRLSSKHRDDVKAAIDDLTHFCTRLVSNEFISHTTVRHPGRDWINKSVNDATWEIFHSLPQPRPGHKTPLELAVIDLMTESGRQARKEAHQTALTFEIAYRAHNGWYGIFNTLTCTPESIRKIFHPDSTAFKDYIRRVDRLSAQASYGSVRAAQGREHHSYFAVVEEGARTGHLHIHVLHWLKTLPTTASDPNLALAVPTRRELSPLKALWPYGFSAPIMVRYSPVDAYGLAGYRWPFDTRINKPLLVKSPLALAGYMVKYITKSYTSPKRSKYLWRIRKTQLLGNAILQELLSTLTPSQLLLLADNPTLSIKLNNQLIPHQLLSLQALKSYQASQASKTIDGSILAIAKNTQPLPSPLQLWRGSTQKTRASNPPSSTPIQTSTIKRTATSDVTTYTETLAALKSAGYRIRQKYFRTSTSNFGTTSTRDHIYPS